MNNKVRVLVFPCGSENAAEIHQALRYSVHVELFGASSVDDHGRFMYKNYFGDLPKINEDSFDSVFSNLIISNQIDLVFATHDTVMEYLAPKADEMNFFLVNGDPYTAAVARKKSLTYELFADCAWCPKVFSSIEEILDWPIIAKPDLGQGGQGVTLVHNPAAAKALKSKMAEPVFVEHLPGAEITVDCFTDGDRKLIWVGPRTRERVRAGITMRSQFLGAVPEIDSIAREINERLKLRGPWFFQLKLDVNEKWKLLEISCRVAGGMVSQRARGVNLPLMAVQDFMGRKLKAHPNNAVKLIERNIATKTELNFDYDTVFVDLDDTLIIDGFAEHYVVAFLYQSIRSGKKIKLITRHEFDIANSLRNSRLSLDLFDEIIHVVDGSAKSNYINGNSIFIDNHFPERLDVATKCGVPVFDVDAVEFFLK